MFVMESVLVVITLAVRRCRSAWRYVISLVCTASSLTVRARY